MFIFWNNSYLKAFKLTYFIFKSLSQIEVVVSSAVGCQLGPDRPGYRIVNVKNDQITHQYFSVE